jgi:hypothetical protein
VKKLDSIAVACQSVTALDDSRTGAFHEGEAMLFPKVIFRIILALSRMEHGRDTLAHIASKWADC